VVVTTTQLLDNLKVHLKKNLIRSEVRESGLGNRIPVENIMILNCVSTSHKNPIDIFNDTTFDGICEHLKSETNDNSINYINILDHDYLYTTNQLNFNQFVNECVIYISGFVVKKLQYK